MYSNQKIVARRCTLLKRFKHSSGLSDNYQYLQNSKIPTMHFQASLPRLPIPKLHLTCERYLAAQKPLLIDEAYRKTESNVIQFSNTTGKTLQEMLTAHDKKNKHTSYISQPWFDMYLRDRISLPINYNPMLIFLNDKNAEYNKQLTRAANLLISSLRFYKSLRDGILEPEVYHLNPKKSDNERFRQICSVIPSAIAWYAAYLLKAYPLDMSQYYNLFNSTRIPEIDKDRIVSEPGARHVLVQRNGYFYTFNVLDQNGDILSANEILSMLKYVTDQQPAQNEFPIGVLTTLNRNKWATLRRNLLELGNEKELKLIDSALLHICLDDNAVGEDPVTLTRQFLHGDGTNRWFDKSISLLLSKDGVAAVNFEHSWGDGVAVLRYFQDVHRDSTNNPQVHPNTTPCSLKEDICRLDFKLNSKLKTSIIDAVKSYKSICDSLDINALVFDGIGKTLCKKKSVSPDAIMQLGFQASYHKQTGKFVASYESCSTAAFKHGRTETIRPCTMETKTYSLAANSTQPPSNDELMHLISLCSKKHTQLTKEAAMGQGFDRHLFCLRRLAENNNISCNIFEDPSYEVINHNIISTSTLSSPAVWAGGFGPVVKDGYGIGYVIKDDSLGVLVTNYPSGSNGKDFVTCLETTFKGIMRILMQTS